MAEPAASLESPRLFDWRGYTDAVGVVALITAAGWPLHRRLRMDNANVLMLYLLGVLWVAIRHTRSAAALTSLLCVLAFDLVFVPPYYRLSVENEQYLITFAVLLVTAIVISELTHRFRRQTEETKLAWEQVESEYLRNTLLSGVSHELRTPLTAINGAASTIVEAGESLPVAERREMLDTIVSESERMERLVTNLLDMTRLESGGLRLKKEWVPLEEVIGAALRHLDRRLHGRHVKLDIPEDLPLLHIDSVGIEQVMANLLDNAVEYAPADQPVEVAAKAVDHELCVSVADHGRGLLPGTEQRVFEKFFRSHATESRRGIGLGLTICRGIIEAHGGRISAANRVAGGAEFRFTLPLTDLTPAMDSTNELDND